MIGHVISGRYVVQAIVGTGGMAVVYRAFDKKRNRIVAIKVLRPEFETDEEFVRRFSREAEAASKVSHENIVNMLDVGIDGDMRYIVMEYVDGQTLKELILQRGTIHPDMAIRMTIRILAAVDHAHRNGIVHRDIKPQNILVDSQGRVKVADFGIARMKASQTTRIDDGEGGSALGSVHYFSPEQARGEVADEKSDLYSVGVVMYEMLTGSVPFDGENSVSVALKHVSEAPKSMRDYRNGISKALDEVVMRALSKDSTQRYQTAAEMAADLRKAISHPQGGFVKYPKEVEAAQREREERRRQHQKDKRRLAKIVGACVAIAVVLALTVAVWYFFRIYDTVAMPNLVGQEQLLAQDTLEQMGAPVEIHYSYSEDFEEGLVIGQSAAAGSRIKHSTQITLTVSRGTQWYYLEDYIGRNVDEAVENLAAMGVETVNVDYIDSDSAVGTVVFMNLETGMQPKDAPLLLTVSGRRILMPSLTGLTLEGAQELIQAEGLVVGTVSEGYSADAQANTVIAQGVTPYSQVLAGTIVDLTVNRAQSTMYYPASKFSVVVPLQATDVRVLLETPSGATGEVYHGVLNTGTHRFTLSSTEAGVHRVDVYMEDIWIESQEIVFE